MDPFSESCSQQRPRAGTLPSTLRLNDPPRRLVRLVSAQEEDIDADYPLDPNHTLASMFRGAFDDTSTSSNNNSSSSSNNNNNNNAAFPSSSSALPPSSSSVSLPPSSSSSSSYHSARHNSVSSFVAHSSPTTPPSYEHPLRPHLSASMSLYSSIHNPDSSASSPRADDHHLANSAPPLSLGRLRANTIAAAASPPLQHQLQQHQHQQQHQQHPQHQHPSHYSSHHHTHHHHASANSSSDHLPPRKPSPLYQNIDDSSSAAAHAAHAAAHVSQLLGVAAASVAGTGASTSNPSSGSATPYPLSSSASSMPPDSAQHHLPPRLLYSTAASALSDSENPSSNSGNAANQSSSNNNSTNSSNSVPDLPPSSQFRPSHYPSDSASSLIDQGINDDYSSLAAAAAVAAAGASLSSSHSPLTPHQLHQLHSSNSNNTNSTSNNNSISSSSSSNNNPSPSFSHLQRPRASTIANIDNHPQHHYNHLSSPSSSIHSATLASSSSSALGGAPGLTGPASAGLQHSSPATAVSSNLINNSNSTSVSSPILPPHMQGRARSGTTPAMSSPPLRLRIAPNNSISSGATSATYPHSLAESTLAGSRVSDTEFARTSSQIDLNIDTPMPQNPTRSLWIGNLDLTVTDKELQQAFSVYGAVESIRLLPEKDCAFVNFFTVASAVQARDDILNRLAGKILTRLPDYTVRVGFGRADSAPVIPAMAMTNNRSSTSTSADLSPDSSTVAEAAANNNISAANTNNSLANNNLFASGVPPGLAASVQSSPTRALWIGSIPASTSANDLLSIFSPFGPIESARVLSHKSCGFINMERLDDAVRARKALNGRELFGSHAGIIKIGYAKVPIKGGPAGFPADGENSTTASGTATPSNGGRIVSNATYNSLSTIKGASSVPLDQQIQSGNMENYRSNVLMHVVNSQESNQSSGGNISAPFNAEEATRTNIASLSDTQIFLRELDPSDPSVEEHIEKLGDYEFPVTYYTSVPLPPTGESASSSSSSGGTAGGKRQIDTPKLRDIRKRFESGQYEKASEIDALAQEMLEEAAIISSDHIGNTIIQKFFDKCSSAVRMELLEQISPYLAAIGCHKNGTWAAQKILDTASTEEEFSIMCQHIKPYIPPLLLDSYGNYVVQCILRFGEPHSDIVFDAMAHRCWEVASGRFGARALRACMENPEVSVFHKKRVAIAILMNSIPLSTNANGSLCLTWLLDASQFPGRYKLLATRLAPHVSHLCTHKLAANIVLRIISQRQDPDASKMLLDALFGSDLQVLGDVLADQIHGVHTIQKILSLSGLEMDTSDLVEKVKEVLIGLRVQHIPAYAKLLADVGLAVQPLQPPPMMPSAAQGPPRVQMNPWPMAGSVSQAQGMPGLPGAGGLNPYAAAQVAAGAAGAYRSPYGSNASLMGSPGLSSRPPPRPSSATPNPMTFALPPGSPYVRHHSPMPAFMPQGFPLAVPGSPVGSRAPGPGDGLPSPGLLATFNQAGVMPGPPPPQQQQHMANSQHQHQQSTPDHSVTGGGATLASGIVGGAKFANAPGAGAGSSPGIIGGTTSSRPHPHPYMGGGVSAPAPPAGGLMIHHPHHPFGPPAQPIGAPPPTLMAAPPGTYAATAAPPPGVGHPAQLSYMGGYDMSGVGEAGIPRSHA